MLPYFSRCCSINSFFTRPWLTVTTYPGLFIQRHAAPEVAGWPEWFKLGEKPDRFDNRLIPESQTKLTGWGIPPACQRGGILCREIQTCQGKRPFGSASV